jgi:hypothetical protein
MHRGYALALLAALAAEPAAADAPQRFYDRSADCSVFEVPGFAAVRARWDGPCVRGAADGRGTAMYFDDAGASLALTADFRGGMVVDGDADLRWGDGAHFTGTVVGGRPDGRGRMEWRNGDRYDGDWKAGKAEGHGIQTWANGESYDGPWHDDQPNGAGTIVRRDGSRLAAAFVDGKRKPDAPAAMPSSASVAPSGPVHADARPEPPVAEAPSTLLEAFVGKTLIAVDGSTFRLDAKDTGFSRTVTGIDGTAHTVSLAGLGNGLGTVADAANPSQAIGFYRVQTDRIELTYADGRSESAVRSAADGIAITEKDSSGAMSCTAWYPAGHVFSLEERKAALAAYARHLGIASDAKALRPSCAELAPAAATMPVAPKAKPRHAALPPLAAAIVPAAALEPVAVKPAAVHLIDGGSPPADESVASNCLKVDSDGAYWGFRNHCAYNVQFAYCLLRGVDPMTACADGGVPGSVAANGFGALFADESIAERGTERDFRWVGCRGGAGEVKAYLDRPEPAQGRCVRQLASSAG